MKRIKKNDFELLCDTLEKKRNYIADTRKEVNELIGENYDKYLQLKAETEDMSYMDYTNSLLSVGAFVISVLSIFYNDITTNAKNLVEITKGAWWANLTYYSSNIMMLLIITVAGVYPLLKSLKYKSVGKWRKYIKAVLDEMEEEAETWKK